MTEIKKEIIWIEAAQRNSLAARTRIQPRGWEVGLNESDMDPIQRWCQDHNCGKRISFDIFQFKNKKEMTMFLLRWGGQ
jgi:hypothetical protein